MGSTAMVMFGKIMVATMYALIIYVLKREGVI